MLLMWTFLRMVLVFKTYLIVGFLFNLPLVFGQSFPLEECQANEIFNSANQACETCIIPNTIPNSNGKCY